MRIQKTRLVKLLSPFPPTTEAWIGNGHLLIVRHFLFGEKDEKSLPLANIAEVDVNQMGLLKTIFNYGTMIIRAEGDTVEKIDWVKNPHFYKQVIERG